MLKLTTARLPQASNHSQLTEMTFTSKSCSSVLELEKSFQLLCISKQVLWQFFIVFEMLYYLGLFQVASPTYRENVNTYKVKCGGSLEMWESSGWIVPQDPYGWFQWYCRQELLLDSLFTIVQKFGFQNVICSFSKDILNLSKLAGKLHKITLLQKSNFTFTFELSINQRKNIKQHNCFQHR